MSFMFVAFVVIVVMLVIGIRAKFTTHRNVVRESDNSRHKTRPPVIRSALKRSVSVAESVPNLTTSVVPTVQPQTVSVANESVTESEEPSNRSPEDLVQMFWLESSTNKAEAAEKTLDEISTACEVAWDDDPERDDPPPSVFVKPLRARGCSTADVMIAIYEQTGYRLGQLMDHCFAQESVSVQTVAEVITRGEIDFDSDELDDLLGSGVFKTEQVFQLWHALGKPCTDLIDLYEGSEYTEPSADEIVTYGRQAGYSEQQLMGAIAATTESDGEAAVVALEQGLDVAVIAGYMVTKKVPPSEVDEEMLEHSHEFKDRIEIAYLILHPELIKTALSETETTKKETTPTT